ncbi:MAG: hypothetical protein H7Y11_06700 [Armatimonadetes bacterium]|nr:hypothetical protein [Anaerolineae bacterium]
MRAPLTIERTMTLVLFMLIFALATRIPLDTDTWWHLRAGQWMVEQRQIIQGDPFSYTAAGVVRVQADWLSQIVLYGAYTLAGDLGLALFTSMLATGGMIALYYASAGSGYLRAFVMILGAATAAVFWSARPQMFSFALSAVVMLILALYKRRHIDRLWWLIPVMLLWAQLHGGYFLGLLLLYGTLAGEIVNHGLRSQAPHVIALPRLRKLALVTLLATAVILINPAGLRLLLLPIQTFTLGPLRQFIQEWNPPDLLQANVLPFTALLIVVSALLIARRRVLDWTELALVVGSGYLALTAARNIAFFAVIATPIVTYHLAALMQARGWALATVKRPTPGMIRLNQALLAIVALGTLAKIAFVMDAETVREAQRDIFPVLATEYLNREQPPGMMFNTYNWGGYLMVNAPQYLVYIDGRTDLYGDLVLEFADIIAAEGDWRATLADYDVKLVVIEPLSPLSLALQNEPGWRTAYSDDLAAVYTSLP